MKNFVALLIVVFLIMSIRVRAQSGFNNVFISGPGDATKIMQAYSPPFFKMFGTDMNSGWTTTAKTKSLFHFEISGSASVAFVSQSDKTYDVKTLGLSSAVQPTDLNNTISPTFGGIGIGTAAVNIYAPDHSHYITHKLPSAVSKYLYTPQLQVSVGLWYNTDIILRFIPTISTGIDYGDFNTIGFGLKHDLTSDISGDEPMSFDLAVLFGYTRSNYKYGLSVLPDAGVLPKDASQSTDFSGQQVAAHFNNFNAGAIISKKFGMITPFLLLSYQSTTTNGGLYGNYPFTNGYNGTTNTYTTYTDPVHIDETNLSNLRADVGLQAEYHFIKIFASASVSQYLSVNGGLGVQF